MGEGDRGCGWGGTRKGIMSGMTLSEFDERLCEWRARVCEHLGMDSTQVLSLDETHEPRGGVAIEWKAISHQEPRIGSMYEWAWKSSGDAGGDPVFTGRAGMSPYEWADVLVVAGEKPRLLTREQELMLKGLLAAEAQAREFLEQS